MSCVKKVYVLYVYCYIVVACIFFLTVATFPATYIQQLGRSLQKNEKLVTVCLSRSNFALIHLPQRNTPASKKYTRLKEIHLHMERIIC
jgi:superfamily II DNA/RNA helicase